MDLIEKEFTDSGSLILTPWETRKSDWNVVTDNTGTLNVYKKQSLLEIFMFASYITFLTILFYLFSCACILFGLACRLMAANIVTALCHSVNLLENALVGVALGNFLASVVQSHEDTMSILISLLNNNRINFQNAIPIIFGCNVGNSMMICLFTFMQISNRQSFRRAIGTSILTTTFNTWAVLILLPIEKITGFHYYIIKSFVETIPKMDVFNYDYQGPIHSTVNYLIEIDPILWQNLVSSNSTVKKIQSIIKRCDPTLDHFTCNYPFDFGIIGTTQGLVISIIAVPLLMLFAFLMIIAMKTLHVIRLTKNIRNFLSSFRVTSCSAGGLTAILSGIITSLILADCLSIIIFVSFLVSGRFISVPLAYPFILGVNLGTSLNVTLRCVTVNGVIDNALYVSLCNLLFNILGIVILYIVPWLRLPLLTAEYLGDWAYSHRTISVLLIFIWFIFLPLIIILIAYISLFTLVVLTVPFIIIMFISLIINHMQLVCPDRLPDFLRTWYFLPIWLRSFAPYERCCNFKRFKMLGAKEEGSTSDVFQFMESKPGESISVVMNRIRKESIFQPTNVLLKQAVDTTGTQFSMSKLGGKKKPPNAEGSRTNLRKSGLGTVDQSSSEGSLIEKYTPFQSGAASAVDVRQSRLTSEDSSSVKILTPYSTTKFRIFQQHPKSQRKSTEVGAEVTQKPSGVGHESYVSIEQVEEKEKAEKEGKGQGENTK